MPLVSVVIPVLRDASAVARLIASLSANPGVEVVVVDGGDDCQLDALTAGRAHARLLRTAAGRAHQMNAGAAAARGRWLLFLHADSSLPDGWFHAIADADRCPDVVGGWFRLRLDADAWQARVIERLAGWRVRIFHLPYGDQGIFVRREIFEALGGYRELPLMEDVDFVRRLVRAGNVLEPRLVITTSARRWLRDGWFRRSARNLALVVLYGAGVSPHRLARWYPRGR
jgi:rSAM/selenodomain-associated transferase 2